MSDSMYCVCMHIADLPHLLYSAVAVVADVLHASDKPIVSVINQVPAYSCLFITL